MGVVAISQTVGSQGDAVGRKLAESLGCSFADREVITEAADRFGEAPLDLIHVTEEKPSLLERFVTSERHFVLAIEAILQEKAAHGAAVLCGRGAAFVLSRIPQVLRVRITAPVAVRAQRVQQQDGLVYDAALNLVRQTDRERGARINFLYHVDWNDPLLYHVVLNTEHIWVDRAVQILRAALDDERFVSTPESRQKLADQSIVAQAKVALHTNPRTRSFQIFVACERGYVTLSGVVHEVDQRLAAQEIVRAIPGVTDVLNEVAAHPRARLVGV